MSPPVVVVLRSVTPHITSPLLSDVTCMNRHQSDETHRWEHSGADDTVNGVRVRGTRQPN